MSGRREAHDEVKLPDGFEVGHWTDTAGWTGCTAIIGPPGTVSAGEVRGGGPGTREFELLSPATATPGAEAILLTGGSAFGLAAAEGVVAWMTENGRGFPTPAAPVPLVSAAVLYDLAFADAAARPGEAAGYAACEAASHEFARGCVGAGTGCTAGKMFWADGWTKTGLGAATLTAGAATITAIAAANPYGDILAEDGTVLAGIWRDGAWLRTVEAARQMPGPAPLGEATTLACLVTDAKLTKTEAWLAARSASAGFARALSPAATMVDGDLVACMASGQVETDFFTFSIMAAEVTAAAIRDAALRATDAPGARCGASRAAALGDASPRSAASSPEDPGGPSERPDA